MSHFKTLFILGMLLGSYISHAKTQCEIDHSNAVNICPDTDYSPNLLSSFDGNDDMSAEERAKATVVEAKKVTTEFEACSLARTTCLNQCDEEVKNTTDPGEVRYLMNFHKDCKNGGVGQSYLAMMRFSSTMNNLAVQATNQGKMATRTTDVMGRTVNTPASMQTLPIGGVTAVLGIGVR